MFSFSENEPYINCTNADWLKVSMRAKSITDPITPYMTVADRVSKRSRKRPLKKSKGSKQFKKITKYQAALGKYQISLSLFQR